MTERGAVSNRAKNIRITGTAGESKSSLSQLRSVSQRSDTRQKEIDIQKENKGRRSRFDAVINQEQHLIIRLINVVFQLQIFSLLGCDGCIGKVMYKEGREI